MLLLYNKINIFDLTIYRDRTFEKKINFINLRNQSKHQQFKSNSILTLKMSYLFNL